MHSLSPALLAPQGFVDRGANGVRGLGRRADAFGAGEGDGRLETWFWW